MKEKSQKAGEAIKNHSEEADIVSSDEIVEIKKKYPYNPLAAAQAIQDLYDRRVSGGGFSLKS